MPKQSLADILYNSIGSKGINEAVIEFNELSKHKDKYSIREGEINNIGYLMLKSNKLDESIEVFKLNVALFPNSFNVYDSLGEAYMKKGENELAIENYKKSVELNPSHEGGKKMLEKLESK